MLGWFKRRKKKKQEIAEKEIQRKLQEEVPKVDTVIEEPTLPVAEADSVPGTKISDVIPPTVLKEESLSDKEETTPVEDSSPPIADSDIEPLPSEKTELTGDFYEPVDLVEPEQEMLPEQHTQQAVQEDIQIVEDIDVEPTITTTKPPIATDVSQEDETSLMDGELFILEEEEIRAEPDIESPPSEKQDISTQHLDEPVELDEPAQPTFELATDSASSKEEEVSLIDEDALLLEEEIVTIEPDSPSDLTPSDIESLPSEEYDPNDINAVKTKELEEQQQEEDLKIIIESDEPVPATDMHDEDVVKFEDHDAIQEDSDPLQDLIDQPEISESIEPEEVIEFEEIEFLEEIEPLESSPPKEEEILEETEQLDLASDDEELFKELLLDKEEEGDEIDPSLTTDEDESEDIEDSVIPSVEQETQETVVETQLEEPEFLEDFEIYEEEEPQKLAPAQTTAQEKPQDPRSTSFFKRLAERLSRTRDSFINQMDQLFLGKKQIDSDLLDDLEELLITSDLGVATTSDIIEHARRQTKRNELSDPQALKALFKEKIRSYIMESTAPAELVMPDEGPFVIMVIGVNGVGKTTTIGKITHKFIRSEQSVLLVAADTFRAAAVSQLTIWGDRNNVEVVSGKEGVDPSSVAFDAMDIAREKDYDVVIVDTAGRLHTQSNLMEELKKIKRVMGKRLEGAPHEILLVLDATTGQNGVSQAKLFNEAVGVTGLAVTKLDGTAKGGIVANVCRDLKIPIRFIGIGEQIDDLRDFDPDEFIEALFHERDPS